MVDEDDVAWKLLNSMRGEVSLPELMDILDERTATPQEAREYIHQIEAEGIAERTEDGEKIRYMMRGVLDPDVVRREGEYSCRRCSRGLSTGHFIKFDDETEEGPYGPDCVRKVLGRD